MLPLHVNLVQPARDFFTKLKDERLCLYVVLKTDSVLEPIQLSDYERNEWKDRENEVAYIDLTTNRFPRFV
jgi:hypothetical protein